MTPSWAYAAINSVLNQAEGLAGTLCHSVKARAL